MLSSSPLKFSKNKHVGDNNAVKISSSSYPNEKFSFICRVLGIAISCDRDVAEFDRSYPPPVVDRRVFFSPRLVLRKLSLGRDLARSWT